MTYDRFHKGNPFGPTVMGACRALVYAVAAAALAAATPAAVTVPAVAIGAYVAGLSYAARQDNRFKRVPKDGDDNENPEDEWKYHAACSR